MKLTFKVFGHEVATWDLEMDEAPQRQSVAEKVAKGATRRWIDWLVR